MEKILTIGICALMLLVVFSSGCVEEEEKEIQENGGGITSGHISADFTYLPTSPEIGDIIQFTDTSTTSGTFASGTFISWDWDFGDWATSTLQNPTHQYSKNGTYTVSLTVTHSDEGDPVFLHTVGTWEKVRVGSSYHGGGSDSDDGGSNGDGSSSDGYVSVTIVNNYYEGQHIDIWVDDSYQGSDMWVNGYSSATRSIYVGSGMHKIEAQGEYAGYDWAYAEAGDSITLYME